jgi:Leucine-rich repeat (LRR) protein
LKRSDIEAIASLPRLKSLNIDCEIADDAVSAISRCKGLKHLTLRSGSFDLTNIFSAIGGTLISLDYTSSTAFLVETVDAIVEHCPNLQMLDLGDEELDVVDLLKGGLKKLAKLNVNGGSVRLGTDWEGYR